MSPRKLENPKEREQLFHITKRVNASLGFKIIIRVVSVVFAMLVCALVLNIFSPGKFASFFSESFNALTGIGTKSPMTKVFNSMYDFAILLGISIALLPAFKMKFWNLGAEGQILIGGLAAALVSKYIGPNVSNGICIVIMAIAAMLTGGIWAVIPGFFKAKFETNEVLFTLMMNYLAMGLIVFFMNLVDPNHGTFSDLTNGVFLFSGDKNYLSSLIPFIVVALMSAFAFVYLRFTKHGYELDVVGQTRNTAKYIGINVRKVTVRTVLLSGLLCGIIGCLVVMKTRSISSTLLGGKGFTGVMIAWLGHFDVIEIFVMSFLVAFISRGSSQIATKCDLGDSFTKISIAVFLIVVLAFEFFLNYEIRFNEKFFKSNKGSKEAK